MPRLSHERRAETAVLRGSEVEKESRILRAKLKAKGVNMDARQPIENVRRWARAHGVSI